MLEDNREKLDGLMEKESLGKAELVEILRERKKAEVAEPVEA